MLHLQLPKWHKRNSFFTKIFGISLCMHGIGFGLFFFMPTRHSVIIFSGTNVPVFLAQVRLVSFKTPQRASFKTTLPSKQKNLKVAQKKQTTVQSSQKNKAKKNTIVQNKAKKSVAQIHKKIDQTKEAVLLESTSVQQEQQKSVIEVTHKEYDALQAEHDLHKALSQVWSPPVGIDPHIESRVHVTIDWNGVLVDHKILQKTHSILFDIAVQEALHAVQLPKQFWGKEVTLVFKP